MDASACFLSILNKSIPEKVDLFIGKPIESEIITADILKGVVSTIFYYAVQEPTFCPMFAQLCSDLKRKLDPFPSAEPGGKEITIRRVMVNTCQHAFEGLENLREQRGQMNATKKESASSDKEKIVKHRALVSIRLIGELFKLKMVPGALVHHVALEILRSAILEVDEGIVEALCVFIQTIGKEFNDNLSSFNNSFFDRLKALSAEPHLTPRIRLMVVDILDIRWNNGVFNQGKPTTCNYKEKSMRLPPCSNSSSRNIPRSDDIWADGMSRVAKRTQLTSSGKKLSANQRFPLPKEVSFTCARYNALVHAGGGFTPIRSEEYFWYPVDYQVYARTQCEAVKAAALSCVDNDKIRRIIISLLNEYFSVFILDDVLQFIEELKSPYDYPEFVKEAIFLFLNRSPPCVEPIAKLLDYMLLQKVFVKTDLRTGCRAYASLLDDFADNYLALATTDFGEIMGHLVLSGGIDFKVVGEVIDDMGNHHYHRQAVFDGVLRIVRSSSSGNVVLKSQADDVAACERLY